MSRTFLPISARGAASTTAAGLGATPGANDPEGGILHNPVAAARAWIAIQNFLSEIFALLHVLRDYLRRPRWPSNLGFGASAPIVRMQKLQFLPEKAYILVIIQCTINSWS